MPILEFQCPLGHITEEFFTSISAGEKVGIIECAECAENLPQSSWATKIFSAPLGFGLYGNPDGYDKPSATKRFSTKTISSKDGNR